MAGIEEDDEFGSDNGFDDFDALQQLEQQAWLSTQRQRKTTTTTSETQSSKLERALVHRPEWHPQKEQSRKTHHIVLRNRSNQPSIEYGFEDEDIINLDQNSYSIEQPYDQETSAISERLGQGLEIHTQHKMVAQASSIGGAPGSADRGSVAEMQARILQLENDRLALEKQVKEARDKAQSKAGEAAMLRQKAEKAAKDYEQRVSTLRQLHAEEFARHKAELSRIKSEREKVVTDNRFLEHDLALEAGKNRQIQKSLSTGNIERARSIQRGSPAVTPKRTKILPHRDGFDDGDLVMLSPSKPRDRTKLGTPRAGTKRKRNVTNDTQSPIAPLQLSLSAPKQPPVLPRSRLEAKVTAELLSKLSREQKKLRFMQNLLRHHILESEENIFEALTRFALPTAPGKKLSRLVHEQLSVITSPCRNVLEAFCNILFSLWESCLAENFYQPIACIIDSIQSIFETERFVFIRKFVARTIPLAIATSDLVAIPTARASLNKRHLPSVPIILTTDPNRASENTNPHAEAACAAQCIDVLACLTLLRTLAEASMPSAAAIRVFWEQMKFDFVLLVLMKAQPVVQISSMLDLLQGSALDESFGAIISSGDREQERQTKRESDTVDRLTLLLAEEFGLPKDEDGNTRATLDVTHIFDLRVKAVGVLLVLCQKDHGAALLVAHRYAIGRMFKFLHDSIRNLYLYTHPTDHRLLTSSINGITKVLYTLCRGSAKLDVDLRLKLSMLPGGIHVHLLALTRLTFAERIWYESGIEEGTVERAHEMLDEWLSPEEGDGLMMMFGSSGSGDGEV